MKILFAFIALLFAFTSADAQVLQLRAQPGGKLVVYGKATTATTIDTVDYVMDTVHIAPYSSGLIEVSVVAADSSGNGITGRQIYRYKKGATTLTLSAATNDFTTVVDNTIGSYTFTKTASENLKLTITGSAGVRVKWKSLIVPLSVVNSPH